MRKALINASQIVTLNTNGKHYKSGSSLKDAGVIENHALIIENGIIKDIVPNEKLLSRKSDYFCIDVSGKIILPGLIDCHTHTVFAGSRANEFRKKIAGVSYEEIAAEGGGINASVKAVRQSSAEEIFNQSAPRVENFISQGVTTLEIKSGYGLDFDNEIKMLEVIDELNSFYPIDIIPTFLGAHTFPPEFKEKRDDYIEIIIDIMLPYVAKNKLAEFCDGFCEKSAFTTAEIDKIFTAAAKIGYKLKLHTEQFNLTGGIDIAVKHKALSVEHLEVAGDEEINKVIESGMAVVLLPGVSYFLNYGYAPARELIDKGATIALSTDFNPGSSYIMNIPMIMSLAAIKMRMTVEEILAAFTINAAKALGIGEKTGSIELNKKADLAVFDYDDYAEIVYNTAHNGNYMTIKEGEIIY